MSEKHRCHPVFAGFDTTQPILLTTVGGNALADFYGTRRSARRAAGRRQRADRASGRWSSTRVGAGRVIFVGWRLADFTTAGDPYRANLERLFRNLLRLPGQAEHAIAAA